MVTWFWIWLNYLRKGLRRSTRDEQGMQSWMTVSSSINSESDGADENLRYRLMEPGDVILFIDAPEAGKVCRDEAYAVCSMLDLVKLH